MYSKERLLRKTDSVEDNSKMQFELLSTKISIFLQSVLKEAGTKEKGSREEDFKGSCRVGDKTVVEKLKVGSYGKSCELTLVSFSFLCAVVSLTSLFSPVFLPSRPIFLISAPIFLFLPLSIFLY